MDDSFSRQVRPFIDLIDELRGMGIEKEIDLPVIAVCGDQSSGTNCFDRYNVDVTFMNCTLFLILNHGSEILSPPEYKRCAIPSG